jgi:formate dehydrogenase major subunit
LGKSAISRGRLCPKGQASKSYVQSPLREYKAKYRRPYGTRWEELSLDDAMEMIAQRIVETRAASWEEKTEDGNRRFRRVSPRRLRSRRRGRAGSSHQVARVS